MAVVRTITAAITVAGVMASVGIVSARQQAPPSTPQRPVFRAGVDVVAVDVAVTRGRTPVTGLRAGDFRLLDNGVPQQIDAVLGVTVPIDVTLVLDLAGSTSASWAQMRADAEQIRQWLTPTDRIRIVAAAQGSHELVAMQPAAEPLPAARLRAGGMVTSLFDAVFHALARPAEVDRRQLVVVFTDGFDTWSILDGRRLPAIAERADAVLHAVVTASPPASPPAEADNSSRTTWSREGVITDMRLSRGEWQRRIAAWNASQRALFAAVDRTGGALHHAANRAEAFERILADFRSSYLLRYTPRGVAAGGWHDIEVTVPGQRGLTVRARRGYQR